MKVSQKIISLVLVLTMAMGLVTTPSFAAAENTEYENSLKAGWGSTFTNWTAPSGYGYSWNAQVLRFFTEFNTRIKNIYDTLGTTNSVLGDIKTRTGYIPTINDNILKLYSGWGTFPNWSQPSSMGSSWHAWVQKALYQFRSDLSDIVSNTSYLSNYESYLSDITTNSAITSTNTTSIDSNITIIANKFGNYLALSPWLSVYMQSSGQVSNSVNAASLPVLKYRQFGTEGNYDYRIDTYPYVARDGIMSYLGAITQNLYVLDTSVKSVNMRYDMKTYRDGITTSLNGKKSALSLMDMMNIYFENLAHNLGDLQFMLADSDAIAAKNANKPQEQNVLSNFTGSGSASASTADFTGVKDSVSALKTSLSGGASYTQAFNILSGDSDGWSWFTNEVAESMDTTSNGNTRFRSVYDSTPYLDSYYSELSSYLGYSYNGGIE